MIDVKVFAASDRNNYGDLLFPILIKKFLEKEKVDFVFTNYGIIKSDLSFFGALPTLPFKELVKNSHSTTDNSYIIIAGGEVLGGGWLNLYRFVNEFWNKIYHNRYTRFLVNRTSILERYSLRFNHSSKPFILDGKRFKDKKIVYNAIGAQGAKKMLSLNKSYIKYFKDVSYLSIRDTTSKSHFDSFNIKNNLIPDSALLMSDLIDVEFEQYVSKECIDATAKKYTFVQLGNNKGPNELQVFIDNLKKFSQQNDLKILLCPIGLALDHSDDILLKSIQKSNPEFLYYHPKNLYEIMFLLKESSIYIGTSLHGVVTAQSFHKPFFVFPEKIPKLKIYVDTWFKDSDKWYGKFDEFDKLQKLYSEFDVAKQTIETNRQKQIIKSHYSKIFGI